MSRKRLLYQLLQSTAHHPAYAFCLNEYERPGKLDIKKIEKFGIPEGHLYKKLQSGEDVTYKGRRVLSVRVTGPRPGRKVGISGTLDQLPGSELFRDCDLLVFDSTYSMMSFKRPRRDFTLRHRRLQSGKTGPVSKNCY